MKKVKSISRFVAAVGDPNDNIEQWTLKTYQELDIEGRETLESHFQPDGKIESKTIMTFNDKGKLTDKITYISEDEIAEDFGYSYTEDGKITKQEIKYADGSSSIKSYDHQNKKINIKIADDEGDDEGREHLEFDDKGNLLEESSWDEDERLLTKNIMQYDDEDNLILKIEFGEDEEFISKTHYKFDEKGNQVEVLSVTQNNDLISRRQSTYNDENLLLEELVDGYKIIYEYDDKGRRTRDEITDPQSNTESFTEYNYHEDGILDNTISCQKGNLMYSAETGNKGGKRAAFIISRYEYEFYDE